LHGFRGGYYKVQKEVLKKFQLGVLTPDSNKEENNHIIGYRQSMIECFVTCKAIKSFLKV
jgi:hypothetical protein